MKTQIAVAALVTVGAVLMSGTLPAAASNERPQLVTGPFNTPGYYDFEITFSSDGKRAVWASDRPGGHGGNDLYYAEFKDGAWGPAINFGPAVNTRANEQEPAMTDDGTVVYFTRYHDPDDPLSGDLYVSRKVNGAWQVAQSWNDVPELPALNTRNSEEHCPIFVNRDLIYFSTDRKGTQASDIWQVARKDGVWGEPEPLPGTINSPYRDHIHWNNLSKDQKMLIVISDRPDGGSLGGSDEWISRRNEKGEWDTPINLGPTVNSAGNEVCWVPTPDGGFVGATNRAGLDQGALHAVKGSVLTLQGFEADTAGPINVFELD